MQDKLAHPRRNRFLGWLGVLVLAGAGAVLGAVPAGYAGLLFVEAIGPPVKSAESKSVLLLFFYIASACALIGGLIGFLVIFRLAKRLLDDKAARTAARIAVVSFPLLAVVGAMAGLGVRWYRISCELDAELAKIKAAGEPISREDLAWYHPVSPAERENAEAFLKACSLLERASLPFFTSSPPADQRAWQQIEEAEPLLQRYKPCLEQLHAAAARPGRTRYLPNSGPDVDAAARLLVVEACVRASHGDGHGAGQSIRTIFALSGTLDDHPDYSAYLSRNYCEKLALNTLVSVLPCGEIPADDLERFKASLPCLDHSEGVHRAMVGWRLAVIEVMRETSRDLRRQFFGLGIVCKTEQQGDFVRYLRYYARLLECGKRPWPESAQAATKLSDELMSPYARSAYSDMLYPYTSTAAGSMDNMFASLPKAKARAQTVRILIAVEQYRRDNDSLPEKLEALVPRYLQEVPQDPFVGHPLRFRLDGNEAIVVYSVGPNGTDDNEQNDDIVVRMDYSAKNAIVAKRQAGEANTPSRAEEPEEGSHDSAGHD